MSHRIASYDGGVVAHPQEFVRVRDVDHIQEVLELPGSVGRPRHSAACSDATAANVAAECVDDDPQNDLSVPQSNRRHAAE